FPVVASGSRAHRLFDHWRCSAVNRASRSRSRHPYLAAAARLPAHAHLHARRSRPSPSGKPATESREGSDMTNESPAYGLWSLVIINSVVFIPFAYTFF